MRTLKYAILGLLHQKPMTGYELKILFNSDLAEFWYSNNNQIYPELKRLHTEGLVDYSIEISGEKLETKRYTITQQGIDDFIQWLHQDEPIPRTPKQTFRLRMYFSKHLELNAQIQLLEFQHQQHVARLESLKQAIQKYQTIPSPTTDDFGDYVVIRGGILREEATIVWLEECISLCKAGL